MQRELSKKNWELDELSKLKNHFLGIAAHDLRNPLGIIMSYSDFLLEDLETELSADQKKMLHTIQNSSEFMHRLLEDLLNITAIESGKLNLDVQHADLQALVQKNVDFECHYISKKEYCHSS
ncbi:MAG TPA: histidine kinase dimerization/phospho-acceptor domain-containing protein [Paludibacter sp.]|nr:histidine kinase dimerization/phospho-acceptor domain-containing protein [Paludibacter sp.]